MDNTHIYTVISFLLLDYPPQISRWVLQRARPGLARCGPRAAWPRPGAASARAAVVPLRGAAPRVGLLAQRGA